MPPYQNKSALFFYLPDVFRQFHDCDMGASSLFLPEHQVGVRVGSVWEWDPQIPAGKQRNGDVDDVWSSLSLGKL